MRFILENVGKITHADVKLDGITVICGENNTGKSTVGKALFGYFTSMCDWESKIRHERDEYLDSCFYKFIDFNPEFQHPDEFDREFTYLSRAIDEAVEKGNITREVLYEIIKDTPSTYDKNKIADEIFMILNFPDEILLGEYASRYFDDIFNGSVINVNAASRTAGIKAIFRNGTNSVIFTNNDCSVSQEEPIRHRAYYVSNPFVIDYLNKQQNIFTLSEIDRNVIEAVIDAKEELNSDKMANIFEAVANKERVRKVRSLLSRAYKGSTVIKNDRYFYHDEEGNDIDFRSISTGLKAFALIERLLESGKLRQEDVLILDEPEIHLHPEWQMLYAELIVLLQREFDLTILIATHSFHFLESLKFFTEKYGIPERGNFYITRKTEGGYAIDEEDNTLESIMKSLSQPEFDLSDMKFEFEMEQNHDDEDDTE